MTVNLLTLNSIDTEFFLIGLNVILDAEMQIYLAEHLCMQVQLYCIVTGSCRPFQRTSRIHYKYEWEGDRELFVAVVLI